MEESQSLAADLGTVWDDQDTDIRLKKHIVRTLIREVVANVDAEAGEINLVIHWKGGVHTELHLSRTGPVSEPEALGRAVGRELLDAGAAGLLGNAL